MPERLSAISESLRMEMEAQHAAREKALAEGRKVIQVCAKAIKHIHRRRADDARRLLAEARAVIETAAKSLQKYPAIKLAPYFQDATKEYVEAAILLAIVERKPLPSPSELGVEPQAYLNGLCEAASECRRFALDELRGGRDDEARRLADEMEDIYDELITFDYPDALTSNLRRNVDSLRAVLERTQSDIAVTGMQLELIEELRLNRSEKKAECE